MPSVIGALAVPRGRGFFRACFDLEQCFVRAWCVLGPILFGAVLTAGLRVFSGHVFVWTFLLSAWVYLGRFCFLCLFGSVCCPIWVVVGLCCGVATAASLSGALGNLSILGAAGHHQTANGRWQRNILYINSPPRELEHCGARAVHLVLRLASAAPRQK